MQSIATVMLTYQKEVDSRYGEEPEAGINRRFWF